jgi:hypothetical protein
MNVYWIQQFSFNDYLTTSGDVQRAYLTIDGFGIRNVAITAQLNVVAPGAHIVISGGTVTGDIGNAAVGIKWYDYIDETGVHRVENTYFVPNAIIRNCIAFQLTLAYRRIWAGATGRILYFND